MKCASLLSSLPRESARRCPAAIASRRTYHDESFGFRKPRAFHILDYTDAQLTNRAANANLQRYVDNMRLHGHRAASIDPLDLLERKELPVLDHERFRLEDGKTYNVDGIVWHGSKEHEWPLEKIVSHMRDIYVGRVGYEYMHSISKAERLWFSSMLESVASDRGKISSAERKRILELLVKSETFDRFLQTKFPNLKRYGLEGGESMLPALDTLFRVAAIAGIEHIIIAMPHRGRMNLLTGLMQFSPKALFHKIKGGHEFPESLGVSGDVISHLVASPTLSYSSKEIKVTLLPNPSHLEAISPVALGKTRAKQFALIKDADPGCMLGDKVMCVQMHGDASFVGQGVVMETLGLSNLPHFTSGGSVHLVVNNNIGYTTPAASARSSLYCSDIAKMINAPILHVNGDYPEDVARAVETAVKYRNEFRKDIVIDLLVYRRWGHNELDEPGFTQPVMYSKIRSRRSVPELYRDKLIHEEVLTCSDTDAIRDGYKKDLEAHLADSSSYTPVYSPPEGRWEGMVWPGSSDAVRDPDTGVDAETLKQVGKASVKYPDDGFELHPRLQRHVKHRLTAIESGSGLDWGTAEALAFGSLMLEGHNVRISGQDVGRGTFSHRHAMLVDQRTEGVIVPLNANLDCDGRLELANSSLSEMAVLGFEYGMSWETPNILPIWEAQFGDFFNGAQVIIDTFLSSSETKWLKQSAIVMTLPHGLDGAGPEHSSMRIERFLQLTNDAYSPDETTNVNMHVVNPTTPAQFFHVLRRQLKRNYRKPLIVASPKGLLRSPVATSKITDLTTGSKFRPVLLDPDSEGSDSLPERLLMCSGKLYYDLHRERASRKLESSLGIMRIEELSPFPFNAISEQLRSAKLRNVSEIVWVQEEPRNQGAWTHVGPRLTEVASRERDIPVRYVGRKEDAVPAVGVSKLYKEQQANVLNDAFAHR